MWPHGVFWAGDIAGTEEGLRAEIIAVQRAAVMEYPNWGSDTCGYNRQLLEEETCGRWLAFSAFTPIMEVGPTKNVGFWDLPRPPSYDETLIAIWRLYARLHQRIADYTYKCAQEAHASDMPIVRPLFLVDANAKEAGSNCWTYLYGPDLLVSPVWKKGDRMQQVYLPSGTKWRDAWNPDKIYEGGQTITAHAELHQIPLYVRTGSNLEVGDLNQQWNDSVKAAHDRPNLKALDAEVKAWFDKQSAKDPKLPGLSGLRLPSGRQSENWLDYSPQGRLSVLFKNRNCAQILTYFVIDSLETGYLVKGLAHAW